MSFISEIELNKKTTIKSENMDKTEMIENNSINVETNSTNVETISTNVETILTNVEKTSKSEEKTIDNFTIFLESLNLATFDELKSHFSVIFNHKNSNMSDFYKFMKRNQICVEYVSELVYFTKMRNNKGKVSKLAKTLKRTLYNKKLDTFIELPDAENFTYFRFRKELMNVNIAEYYDIYKIRDGTSVTLFNTSDTWYMASRGNVFDLNGKRKYGKKTYEELLSDCLAEKYNLSLSNFNKKYIYDIGFRNHQLHPFKLDAQGVWIINIHKMIDGKSVKVMIPPDDLYVNIDNTSIKIPYQMPINIEYKTPAEINRENAGSVRSCIAKVNKSPYGSINYGYILRKKESVRINSVALPDFVKMLPNKIMMRSNLCDLFDKLIYNVRYPDYTRNNQKYYYILKNYLSADNKSFFIMLFPQYKTYFDKFEKMITSLISDAEFLSKTNKRNNIKMQKSDLYIETVTLLVNEIKKSHGSDLSRKVNVGLLIRDTIYTRHIERMFRLGIEDEMRKYGKKQK